MPSPAAEVPEWAAGTDFAETLEKLGKKLNNPETFEKQLQLWKSKNNITAETDAGTLTDLKTRSEIDSKDEAGGTETHSTDQASEKENDETSSRTEPRWRNAAATKTVYEDAVTVERKKIDELRAEFIPLAMDVIMRMIDDNAKSCEASCNINLQMFLHDGDEKAEHVSWHGSKFPKQKSCFEYGTCSQTILRNMGFPANAFGTVRVDDFLYKCLEEELKKLDYKVEEAIVQQGLFSKEAKGEIMIKIRWC